MKLYNRCTIFVSSLLLFAFVACKGNIVSNDSENSCYIGEPATATPDNLETYFDSIIRYTSAFIYTMNVDDIYPNPDSLAVINSIKALNEYQSNLSKVFPREKVEDALGYLAFSQWHYDTHGDDEEDKMSGSELFFFQYLEQVVRLCPHVDYLTSIHTGDDKAGIFTGHEASPYSQPFYNILLYRHGNGYKMKFLQYYIGYDRIRELSDSIGRDYILCYNGETEIDKGIWPFQAILFIEDGDDYQEVCSSKDWISDMEHEKSGFCVDFNPRTLTWTKCRRQGEHKIPISGLNRLHLVLDGENSYFVEQ